MMVLVEHDHDLGLQQVRWRDLVVERLRTGALDQELAAGESPESSVSLALHAARLYRPRHRSRLAHAVREVAGINGRRTRSKIPISRQAVGEARRELEAVASRLASQEPIDVCGVAKVRSLLSDGAGPLYRPSRSHALRDELLSVLRAFDSSE
jgi:hypothetical protein